MVGRTLIRRPPDPRDQFLRPCKLAHSEDISQAPPSFPSLFVKAGRGLETRLLKTYLGSFRAFLTLGTAAVQQFKELHANVYHTCIHIIKTNKKSHATRSVESVGSYTISKGSFSTILDLVRILSLMHNILQ